MKPGDDIQAFRGRSASRATASVETTQFDPNAQIVDSRIATAIWEMTRLKTPESVAAVAALASEPVPGVRVVPFVAPAFCSKLIEAADARGAYAPDPDDPHPGQELSLLFDPAMASAWAPAIQALFTYVMRPLIACCYDGFAVDHVRDSFVIRYSMDGQRSMGIHFDEASDVSAAVALNDAFAGGGVNFPRYNWSTRNVPVGYAVLFPGRVTHAHEALPITDGVRYSMTWWMRG